MKMMNTKMQNTWDENKRQTNLEKHGLDFTDANSVLNSRYRLDVCVVRGCEERIQSFSYVMGRLAVLSLVHLETDNVNRIISFRYASKTESEIYYDWLATNPD